MLDLTIQKGNGLTFKDLKQKKTREKALKNVCHECIEFFHLPFKHEYIHCFYEEKCDGCLKKTEVTNPLFYLKIIEGKKKSYALNAGTPEETQKCT